MVSPNGSYTVSILTGPPGPVQLGAYTSPAGVHLVSILTGPPGPVQPVVTRGCAIVEVVSILTGPPGPVQQGPRRWNISASECFNPHRTPWPGATRALRSAR